MTRLNSIVGNLSKQFFENLLNIEPKRDMRYLSIDFGTVLTKAAVYETVTQKLILVQMNEDDVDDVGVKAHKVSYEMPTAVFFDSNSQKYKIGQEAVNSRGTDPDNFHSLFKPKLSEPQSVSQYYLPFVEEILKYVIIRAQKTIKPNNTFSKIVLTVPASTIKGDNRWLNMEKAIINAVTQLEEQTQQQIIVRRSADSLANYIEIIKEPEAASYSILKKTISNYKNGDLFLVYDFGGGTFDPALLEYKNKTLRSIGEWDSDIPRGKNIGGIYIDELIKTDIIQSPNCEIFEDAINYFSNFPISDTGLILPPEDKEERREWRRKKIDMQLLEDLSIEVKHELSSKDKFSKNQYGDYEYELTREDYYDMIDSLIDDTIQCCSILLSDYGYSWKNIKEVFLVGGSSMIPLVRDELKAKCQQEDATFTIPSMTSAYDYLHAVALGAALYDTLKPTDKQRFDFGIEALQHQDWVEAEYQFAEGKSYYGLGLMEYEGLGRKKLFRKAYEMFSTHNEDPKCSFMQALMLFKGEGVIKNDERALKVVKKMLDDVNHAHEKAEVQSALIQKGAVLNSILKGDGKSDDFESIYENNFYKIV